MQFNRLRLIGFKSFVEPSDFMIEPGLTGIVGPNGCGKSNLVEAMRWVMGEASHKAMRAQDMDQVIFSGSSNRPSRNMAEVILQIDNSDRGAPAAFNDEDILEVSRRIEREAGSAYRINGREVRARDVQLLFADASSGARSPAMVRQGQIGEIVNAKPESRRRILEEAAGISGLHARRHEAETRLKGAGTNLQRLEDVIGQIASQIDGLKRQARQAVRYKKVAAEIRRRHAMLIALRWREAEAAAAEAAQAVDLTVRAVAEKTGLQAEATTAQTNLAEQLHPLREAEARAAATLQRLNHARSDLDREEGRAKQRTEELDRRLEQLAQDIEHERKVAADASQMIERLAREEAELAAAGGATPENREAVQARYTAAESKLSHSEKAFSEAMAALAEITARRGELERALRAESERLARLDGEIAALDQEANTLSSGEGGEFARVSGEATTAQEAVAAADARVLRAEAARSAAVQTLPLARAPLTEAERRLRELETEARTLAKVLDVAAKTLWPPVVDTIEVAAGYETALGVALGDDLDAPTDSAAPTHWAGTGTVTGDPVLPAGAEPLSAHVKAPDALARRLAQIGVVARSDGTRLKAELKPGQRLVSREGDLWRWDGFVVTADAETAAGRKLAARNRLAEIDREIETARAMARRLAEAAEAAEADVKAAEADEIEARNAWRAAQAALEAARAVVRDTEHKSGERTARLTAIHETRALLSANRAEADGARRYAEDSLAALGHAAEREAELEAIRGRLSEDRAAYAAAKVDFDGLEREQTTRTQRLTAIGGDRAAWHERAEAANARLASLETRLTETRTERADLDAAPAAFAEQRQKLMSEFAAAEAERRACADRLAEAENAVNEAERVLREASEALSEVRSEAARAEARLEAARERRTEMLREITEALGAEPSEARIQQLFEEDGEPQDQAAVEARLERLEQERERLGAVNLRAEEELTEIETQHQTMTTERDDLVEAIKRLRQGINSLDREARARLTASFAVVNDHFKKLFKTLFGGGNAELILTNSEDPLEAGLDIVARPPGKKSQTLSLLSGGEQALTALALIFAVFLTNPAPICVLDEVDAPLDDANVERFCNMLDEMQGLTKTRFVVVTHNPITMSRMSRLFGVTMAELGVSQLVSVDLVTAQSFREAS
jgi:chromosome segregation protein